MADDAVRKAYLGELVTVHEDETRDGAADRTAAPATTTASPAAELAPLLELRDVDAGYGPFRAALRRLVLGARAARPSRSSGPTARARPRSRGSISGLVPVTDGTVLFDGVDITGMKPWRIAPLGIVHAPEGRSVFGTLTVEENLTLEFRRSLGRKGVECRPRARVRAVPASRRAPQAGGRHALGRRAAHAGARAGARAAAAPAHRRRAVARARTDHHRRGLRDARAGATGGDDAAAHRAVRRSCAAGRRRRRAAAAR